MSTGNYIARPRGLTGAPPRLTALSTDGRRHSSIVWRARSARGEPMPISSATPVERAPAARFVFSFVRSRITWLRAAEAALLIVTLGLRLWALDQNGFGIEYYSAAVRSMTQSWHNFFYNSFDPAGFLSVDKPPLPLWIRTPIPPHFSFHPSHHPLP